MMKFLDMLLGRTRVLVKENERVLILHKGEVKNILGSGEHMLPYRQEDTELRRHDLANPVFGSPYEKALFSKLPDVAKRHLTLIRTQRGQIAVVERDGGIYAVLGSEQKMIVWNDAGPWSVSVIDVAENPVVEPGLLYRLVLARKAEQMAVYSVADGQAGLLFLDGVFTRTLTPGVHAFWNLGRQFSVKVVDLKRQSLDITGQELLTRDRVTIRVNIAAEYRVTDPVLAVSTVKDFQDNLYRALQYAFRRTLGSMTLDQILEKKATLDEDTVGKVRAEMAQIGVELEDVAVKDVILPGEMRDILNQVIMAEKQAEANVIRRREETNATRSLLNTAKVMAENPVMLRLKELEALEAIAGKVERLTVHNGTVGLMNDLVKLRDM